MDEEMEETEYFSAEENGFTNFRIDPLDDKEYTRLFN